MDEKVTPLEEEDEEQEEQHKNGRSAFFAGVFAADSFTGSFRGVPAPPHGGAVSVRPEDVIGSPGTCWCGQPIGHAWPGKDLGVPHPREETTMSTATDEAPYLDVRQLRKFDRDVVRMVKELVNTYGVPYRFTGRDGMHLLLYPLAPGGKTYKVSCSVQPQTTLASLEKWVARQVTPHLVEMQAEALAAKFNDPSKRVRKVSDGPIGKPAGGPAPTPVASEPAPEPEAPESPDSAPPAPSPEPAGEPPVTFEAAAPAGYRTWVNAKGEQGPWWRKNDADEWICKDCGFVVYETAAMSGHRRAHNPELFRRKRVANYLRKAAEEMGVDLSEDTARLDREVSRLTEQVAKVTAERDDLKARLALITEAMRA